jgi:uncharacterized RDD family membrane protein YckC
MSDREPALLGHPPAETADEGVTAKTESVADANTAPTKRAPTAPPVLQRSATSAGRRDAASVWVVGFWKRLVAAVVDGALIIPAALLVTLIVSKIAGVHLPARNLHVTDIDLWIDLVLASDPALLMGFGLTVAVALVYLLVFHITLGRTLGMRLLNIKVIDVYGDAPSPARCVARCAGYLAGFATLFLGFLWIGFDSEKRGLQDWIAGTYVIKAS